MYNILLLRKLIILFVLIIFLVSCSYLAHHQRETQPIKPNYSDESMYEILLYKDSCIDSLLSQIDALTIQVESLTQEIEMTYTKVLVNDTFEIPASYSFAGVEVDLTNERVRARFESIYESELKRAHQFIPRSGQYFALMDKILEEHGLHSDLKYLAVAESNLSSMAMSPARAGGIWQFIPSTAKLYNLKIDSYLDERRNIFKSTEAACKYLLRAHAELSSQGVDCWLVTIASYNAGVGNILRSVREQNGYDFFSLIMRVEETNQYVWRAIATKMIFEYESEIFAKTFERYQSLLEANQLVFLESNGYYNLSEWASAYGTNINTLWELNPWINISRTNSGRYSKINHLIIPPGKYGILVPNDVHTDYERVAAVEKKYLVKNNSAFLNGDASRHKVQKGETLSGIANRYHVRVSDIKKWNNLKNDMIIVGQVLYLQAKVNSSSVTQSSVSDSSGSYRVNSGETLDGISKKLGVSSKYLMSKNNLSVKRQNGRDVVIIIPGQVLEY